MLPAVWLWLVAMLGMGMASTLPSLDPLLRGGLVVAPNWLPADLTQRLRQDAITLQQGGSFAASGLSNTAKGDKLQQGFNEKADRSVCAIRQELAGDRESRAEFNKLLEGVRSTLGRELGRELVCAEQYYSASGPGAKLARHMDERHEELKGARGYSAKYRRSISWLCYLCEDGWDDAGGPGAGGALRAYVRDGAAGALCGSHEGNLQVAWRDLSAGGAEPVFLDAWVQVEAPKDIEGPRYLSYAALYRVVADATGAYTQRDYISGLVEGGGAHTLDELLATLKPDEAKRFAKVDVPAAVTQPPTGMSEALVPPLGGTLLLFVSVSVPHEVLATTSGVRWAMAGWLHEPSQGVPDWLYL